MPTTRLRMERHQLREFAQGLLEPGVTGVIIALSAPMIVDVVAGKRRCVVTSISETRVRMSAKILRARMLTSQVPSGERARGCFAATKQHAHQYFVPAVSENFGIAGAEPFSTPSRASSKAPGNEVARELALRRFENLGSRSSLDNSAVGHDQRVVADAPSLAEIVSDNDDRVLVA